MFLGTDGSLGVVNQNLNDRVRLWFWGDWSQSAWARIRIQNRWDANDEKTNSSRDCWHDCGCSPYSWRLAIQYLSFVWVAVQNVSRSYPLCLLNRQRSLPCEDYATCNKFKDFFFRKHCSVARFLEKQQEDYILLLGAFVMVSEGTCTLVTDNWC